MWLVGQWASIHFEHSRCELAQAEFTMLCSWTRHLTLTMPHSSNNIKFGGLGGTHTCKNKTLVFNCGDHFHFHRFCVFYFFLNYFFLVGHRRNLAILLKIRATFRRYSAEFTANSNTLDVFRYKTNGSTKTGNSESGIRNPETETETESRKRKQKRKRNTESKINHRKVKNFTLHNLVQPNESLF